MTEEDVRGFFSGHLRAPVAPTCLQNTYVGVWGHTKAFGGLCNAAQKRKFVDFFLPPKRPRRFHPLAKHTVAQVLSIVLFATLNGLGYPFMGRVRKTRRRKFVLPSRFLRLHCLWRRSKQAAARIGCAVCWGWMSRRMRLFLHQRPSWPNFGSGMPWGCL